MGSAKGQRSGLESRPRRNPSALATPGAAPPDVRQIGSPFCRPLPSATRRPSAGRNRLHAPAAYPGTAWCCGGNALAFVVKRLP